MGIRIAKTEVWQEDLQLTRAYRIAGEDIAVAHNAFCLIQDANGNVGIGAASPMPEICGESLKDTMRALNIASDLLALKEIETPELLWQTLSTELIATPAALAAVDMAFYDLFGKVHNMPVYQYLGGKRMEMETSVTIGITDEEQAHEELLAHLKNDFRVIKVKIGDDVERDIAVVRKLREWGGSQFRLRVDANEGYDLDELTRFLKAVEDANVELVEQPFPAPGSALMHQLPFSERARCMADEDLVTEANASVLAGNKAYGIWNIKLMKSGGITCAKRMAAVATQAGIQVMWGCNDESRVSITAALHTAFSSPATRYLDLDGSFDIARDVVSGGFVVDKGKLRLTDAPGLGVTRV
jgi:L-alanine-DL-glutamate epimerase-like enolase superfamily enzyme